MKILIIDPLHNSPGEHDDDGAFELGAQKLAAVLGPGATRFSFDNGNGYAARFAELRTFVKGKQFDGIVEVSHSTHTRLQSGVNVHNVDDLLHELAEPLPRVAVLLACSAASPPIESSISFQLARHGVETIAHSTVGHAYLNPHLVDVRLVGGFPMWRTIPIRFPSATTAWRAWVAFVRRGGWVDVTRFALGVFGDLHVTGLYRDVDGFIRWTPPGA